MDLRLRLAPLLRGRVEADRLVVTAPVLRLRRRADGTDNFTFAPSASGGGGGASGGGASPEITLDRIAIVDGLVAFTDEAAGAGVRLVGLRLESDLTTAASGRSVARGEAAVDSLILDGPAPIPALPVALSFELAYDRTTSLLTLAESSLAAGPLRFKLTGDYLGRDGAVTAHGRLVSDRITAADLIGLLPADRREVLSVYRIAGDVVVEAETTLEPGRSPVYAATAGLTDLVMSGGELPGELRVASARADLRPDSLHVALTQASFGGRPLQGRLSVTRFADPHLRGNLGGEIDLAYLQPFLPPQRRAVIAGALEVRVELDGSAKRPERLLRGGEIVVRRMTYRDALLGEPLTALEAKCALTPEAVTVTRCDARFGASDVALTGRIADPFAGLAKDASRRSALTFTARSRRFDVDRIFPAASPAWVRRGTTPAADAPRDTLAARLPDLRGVGTLSVDSLLYGRVAFTGVTGNVRLADRRIEVADVAADVYTGKVSGSTTVDLNDPEPPVVRRQLRGDPHRGRRLPVALHAPEGAGIRQVRPERHLRRRRPRRRRGAPHAHHGRGRAHGPGTRRDPRPGARGAGRGGAEGGPHLRRESGPARSRRAHRGARRARRARHALDGPRRSRRIWSSPAAMPSPAGWMSQAACS